MRRPIILAVLLLTLNPAFAQPNQPRTEARTTAALQGGVAPRNLTGRAAKRELEPVIIRAYLCAYALKYGVEPAAAMAVAHVESSKGGKEFRTGMMGRTYYGPMGIHKCFLKRWPIDQTETNIEVGVRALARHKDLKTSLKKYNTAFENSYWAAVVTARAKYRRIGVGG